MKTYKVSLRPDAISDLQNIYTYISEASGFPDVAIEYIRRLKKKCETLTSAPHRGLKRDDIRPNLRTLALDKRTVAAFEINEEAREVDILNIFYGGRDYEILLSGDA